MPISIFIERYEFDNLHQSDKQEQELRQRGYKMTYEDYDGISRFRYFRKNESHTETIVVKLIFNHGVDMD